MNPPPDPLRREFLKRLGAGLAAAAVPAWLRAEQTKKIPMNVLLFTADDLHTQSLSCYGGRPEGITPHLDAFAAGGMRFERAHVNAAICAPSRAILATGLYGHRSGATGFTRANPEVPTLMQLLRDQGYLAGILGKVDHSTPHARVTWDYSFDRPDLGDGRDPELYYQRSRTFFDRCREEGKPFYFMVNSHDPHRPFQTPGQYVKGRKPPTRLYQPDEVDVPDFLPDLPGVRQELSAYLNSVRRLDDSFGETMRALRESGFADNTLVMFLSDNGMAFPFAKANTYLASTQTPWIVSWPERIKPGSVDRSHFISGIDFLPTVLEAAGLPPLPDVDGRSFLDLLQGRTQADRDRVYTQIDTLISGFPYPMRCVQDERFGYIVNFWSDGDTRYRNANEGDTMAAMVEAARTDEAVAQRVKMFRFRVPEELYDLQEDPGCLHNLLEDPAHGETLTRLRGELEAWMVEVKDPFLQAMRRRGDADALRQAVEQAYGPPENRKRARL